jgi:hypothetical protein
MSSVAVRSPDSRRPAIPRMRQLRADVLGIWSLAGALVLYLALEGGGYDQVIHSRVAILLWWIILISAAWGLLPRRRPGRAATTGLALFGAFIGWTALGVTWSLSVERSLNDLSLVAGYLGVLVLGVFVARDRNRAVRHTVSALASAISVTALLALASRLDPGLISNAGQTSAFLPGTQDRLSWPLNYWNALAALLVLGVPMLMGLATTARRIGVQALAAAMLPVLIVCGYLTLSRGGALACAVGVIAFLALAPERAPKLASALLAAAGSAALVALVIHRPAIENGLTGSAARHQGLSLLPFIVVVCAVVACGQCVIALTVRRKRVPRFLAPSPRHARMVLGGAVIVIIIVAVAAGVPSRLSRAWADFKSYRAPALHDYSIGRFGTLSGNGRYDYWKVAVQSTRGHVLTGAGPGTFELLWLPRAPYPSYVQNAHSLYFETLAELGVVGLVLLIAFFALVLIVAGRLIAATRGHARTLAAAAFAALLAFMVSVAFDWEWQVPVLPTAFLLLAATVLGPGRPGTPLPSTGERLLLSGATLVVALACLAAIAWPLATTEAVRASQTAAARGQTGLALREADRAAHIEPGAASPQLQIALVQELRGQIPAAISAAKQAAADEPENWGTWLILSRLESEDGRAQASRTDFDRARSLNPRSPIFARARST